MARQTPPPTSASRIRVRVQPRRPIDLQRLARAVIELAMSEVEAEQADLTAAQTSKPDEGAAA